MTQHSSGLKAEGLVKTFGGVKALSDVSIDLPPGKVTAILGENGAGKSTLLKILSGDYIPDSGKITVDDAQQSFSNPFDARKAGIRIVSQEPNIIPDISVAENIFLGKLPGSGGWVNSQKLFTEAKKIVHRLGFDGFFDVTQRAGTLSPSDRQILEIIRTLSDDPYIILFDEPTSSLSDRETEILFDLINRLKASGHAIGYVSHRLNEIFEIADDVIVIRDGLTVGSGPVADFTEDDLIRKMVGHSVEGRHQRASRQLGGKTVLEVSHLTSDVDTDVSLSVHAGEIVVLAGLVGAGRSELARAIFGDMKTTAGTITVDGRRCDFHSPGDAMEAGIGLVPEERRQDALFMEQTVSENIAILSYKKLLNKAHLLSMRKQTAFAERYRQELKIRTSSVGQLVSQLSGGNQQKVVLARWLARNLKVLILDEPTRGVDVGAREEIYDIIDSLAKQGLAILVISSDMNEVLGLADRILVMREGRLSGELSITEATQEKILRLAMPTADSSHKHHVTEVSK